MKKQRWSPDAKIDGKKKTANDTPDVNISGGNHFATRTRVNDIVRTLKKLPDLDPVLRKLGKHIPELQELLTDSHLESVWSVRCAAASGAEYFVAPGDDSSGAEETALAFAAELKDMDIPRVIEEMMDAVAYGYSPLEVLWALKDGRWGISNIVGKPPQWFEFSSENKLVFRTGITGTEELPDNRFLLVQHRPSYANPYGVKVFSKCYWPVTFKKNGFRWWTTFVEKYGGAFMYGKYPTNSGEQFKNELLRALESMISDAVAIAPEGSEITISSAFDKKGGSDVHEAYIKMANSEISKAVLGQTLTTEIGDTGSFAAAQAHNLVREDIAAADRFRICAAFNRLAAVYTFYNFGKDAVPPLFKFVKDEDLQIQRADRDVKLHQVGWRPTREYFARQYGMQEDDFTVQEERESGGFPGFNNNFNSDFSKINDGEKQPELCGCGCGEKSKTKKLLRKFALLFASKKEKRMEKDSKLISGFEENILKTAQRETDSTVDALLTAARGAKDFDDAREKLIKAYGALKPEKCAVLICEARYAASQIGAASGKKGGRKNG